MEQVRLLGHHPDHRGERVEGQVAYVGPVQRDPATVRVVQPRDKVGQRGLAGAARPDHRGQLARPDPQRQVAQRPARGVVGRLRRRRVARVAEPDVVERDLPAHAGGRQPPGARLVDDRRRQVEVREDPGEQRQRGLHVQRHPQQVDDREQQPGLQRGERDQRAGRQQPAAAARGEPGDQVDQRRRDPEERPDGGEEHLPGHRLPDLQRGLGLVLGLVARDLERLPVEDLRQQHAGHRQRLLGDRAHLGQRGLRPAGDPPTDPADLDLQHDEDRQQRDRDERELPGQQQHADQRRDHGDRVGQDRGGGLGHHRLDAADVVAEPGLDVAGPGAGEEAEVHRLQVHEQPVAQVLHDPVAQRGGQERLPDPDQRRHHRDHDHEGDQDEQQPQVGAAGHEQGLVEHRPGQERVRDPQHRGHQDRRPDQRQPRPVRREQLGHPARQPRLTRIHHAFDGAPRVSTGAERAGPGA